MRDKKEYNKQYYRDHRERAKQRYKNNSARIKERSKQYYKEHREQMKQYCKDHREHTKEYQKQYYKENRDQIKEYNKQYQKDHLKERRENEKNRFKTDVKYSLNHKMKNAIAISLKGNKGGRRWENLVNYSLEDLVKRIKRTMPAGYTWQDYLEGRLHIDHRIPISAFNYTKPEHIDFQKCWALNNLRLLPAEENLKKQAKLERSFQPALTISI